VKGQRIVRIVKILTTLQSGEKYAVDELSKMFSASRRTIFRDLKELQNIGVPFRYDSGSSGYVLDPEFFLPPLDLNLQEALSLLVAIHKLSGKMQTPFRQSALLAALKIENNLPGRIRQYCTKALSGISAKIAAQAPISAFDKLFGQIQKAIIDRHRIKIKYHSLFEGQVIEAEVCPYQLLYNRRSWYVIGFSTQHNSIRTFKLNRIKEVETTKKRFYKKDFNVQEYFGRAWSMIPEGRIHHVRLRFLPKVAHNVAEVKWHDTQKVRFNDDGSVIIEFRVDGLNEIKWWILGYGDQVEVIRPKSLRRKIAEVAENIITLNRQ